MADLHRSILREAIRKRPITYDFGDHNGNVTKLFA